MSSRIRRIGTSAAAIFAVLIAAFVLVVLVRSKRTFEAPYPEIRASSDPKVIEAGRYLAYGPGHCVWCHVSLEGQKAVFEGATPPLIGGSKFALPIGTFYTPNLTPDSETGIGRLSDAELARVLRHGVMPDGKAAIPFMEYQNMSEEDMTALISFLRSQPPVRNPVPKHDVNFVGKVMLAFAIKPIGPSGPPPKSAPPIGPTVERGAYLANNVAACAACHTRRSMLDGSYLNERFAGGAEMANEDNPALMFVTPNLTPAPKTGRIAKWPEDQFVGRFQAGVGLLGTHMPWKAFARMSEDDIRALYRYLQSLPPVENATGASLQKKKG